MSSPAPTKPQVWFPDTSALVTLAVHTPLGDDVRARMGAVGALRVLLDAVVGDLHDLAGSRSTDAPWAAKALGELAWLGKPVALDDLGQQLAVDFQEEIRGSRPLRHPAEHWGEAAILGLTTRAEKLTPLMFCDDYNARLAADGNGVKAVGVHKYLHLLIRARAMPAPRAAGHAQALYAAGRHQDYTQQELAVGRLGRVGMP